MSSDEPAIPPGRLYVGNFRVPLRGFPKQGALDTSPQTLCAASRHPGAYFEAAWTCCADERAAVTCRLAMDDS